MKARANSHAAKGIGRKAEKKLPCLWQNRHLLKPITDVII